MNRSHPKTLKPSYWGDSVAYWEGGTLVVDTVGFNGEAENTTATTHVISRLHGLNSGHNLELRAATIDPQTFVEPTVRTITSIWHPELSMQEFQCEENRKGAMEEMTVKLYDSDGSPLQSS